jgi:acyl-CoA synthetase (AMP-forming)/AMP-acid ligase II
MTGARAATTPAILRAAAQRWPGSEAVVDGDVRVTFAELERRVALATRAASAAGLRHGDRAAIWAPNCLDWIVAAIGLQGAGVAVVPLNTRYKGAEAADVLLRSGARLLVTVRGFLGTDYPAMLEGHETRLERTVVLGEASWDEFLAGARGAEGDPPVVTPDDVSDIIFTSGTTGRPKGVMSTHGQTVGVFQAWCDVVGLRTGDRYLVATPFFHTFGYKAGFVAAIHAGAVTYPLAVVEPGAVLQIVDRERITVLPATPTLFQGIFEHPDRARYDTSSLRLSAVGGAAVPADLVRRMRAELFETVVTGYGLTESTGAATMSAADDEPEVVARTVGRALPGVEVRVVDAAGTPVEPGTPGEVMIRGYNVMRGYFEAPGQTADAIDPDGWLHTGDVGTLDAEGRLAITDRLKDMFIVGGFNAYPAEIEAALLGHPDVAGAAVVGVPDPRLGEVGMAFVVPREGRTPDPDELIAWARERMANYKVPRRVAVVRELPLNAVGKVVKDELRRRGRC